jgi:nuclease S1
MLVATMQKGLPAMSVVRSVLLLVSLLCLADPAAAWSARGHRLVAALAEAELSPRARDAALELLRPDGDGSLVDVAVWADTVRSERDWRWSAPLHYVNLSPACDYDAARQCRDGACIVAAIERFAVELADPALPRLRRAEALKFLVHLVGDVHQPLHAGFAADRGGNRFQVNFEGRGSNLHAVWDRTVLDHGDESEAAQLARLQSTPLPRAGSSAAAGWARQSCSLIERHGLYPPSHVITEDYIDQHRPLAETQLRLAAARLVAVLEGALGAAAGA